MKRVLKKNEFYVFLVFLVLCLTIELRSGQFFTAYNIYDILTASIVPGMFALATLVVMSAGGLDVSFPAIASFCMYTVTVILLKMEYNGSILLPCVLAAVFGAVLGLVNGLLISQFELPPLIVTLGTSSMYTGILMGVIKAVEMSGSKLPDGIRDFGYLRLASAENPANGATTYLPISFLVLVGLIILISVMMNLTMFGRSIYAIGSDENAARRAGFRVKRTKVMVYVLSGIIAGVAGIIRMSITKYCHPTNLIGIEMEIIAAVVLGGTSIYGGRGSVYGTVLGVLLIITMKNSLLMLGIPVDWQEFCIGVLIVFGTGISAYQAKRASMKRAKVALEPLPTGGVVKGGTNA